MTMNDADLFKHIAININDTPGRETFVFKIDKADQHYTVQIRHRERIYDVHLTKEAAPAGEPARTTLYQISFHQMGRYLVKMRWAARWLERELAQAKDPLSYMGFVWVNPGWTRRSAMFAMSTDAANQEDIGLLRFKRGGKRIRMGRNAHLLEPDAICLDVSDKLDSGTYVLQRVAKGNAVVFAGILLVLPKPGGKRYLLLPKARMNRLVTQLGRIIFEDELNGNTYGTVQLPQAVLDRFRTTHGRPESASRSMRGSPPVTGPR